MNWIKVTALAICLAAAHTASALNPAQQQTVNALALGGTATLRQQSQSIYNTGETDRGVLDVLAEVMLNNYQRKTNSEIDAMAWACRALGNSGDPRYRNTLQEIANSDGTHRKLKKYANNAMDQLRSEAADPYVKGTVNLAQLRAAAQSGAGAPAAAAPAAAANPAKGAAPAAPAATGGTGSLADVKAGMSEQQVTALLGAPSGTSDHITGKQFNPFYYGGDVARVMYLYAGKGRVIFSVNRYSSQLRVVEVQNNPAETGYP